jgi:predicted MFS family arabinose efflux permease
LTFISASGIFSPLFIKPTRMLIIQLLVILFLGLVDGQMLSPMLPALASEFGAPAATMGMVVTAYACAAAVCALIIGPLSDRWGRIIFLRAAAFLFALTSLLAYFADSFAIYFSARLLAGLAGGTISACVLAQMADAFTFQRRGRAMGWVGAMYSLAAIIGVPAAAWMTDQWSWRSIYLLLAVAAALLAFSLRSFTVHATPQPVLVRQALRDYSRYWRTPATRRGLLLASTISGTAAALLTYLGAFLTASFGMSISAVGFIFLIAGLASTLGAVAGGALSDRVGKQRMVTLCSLALAMIFPVLMRAESVVQLYVIIGAAGLFLAGREGPYQALISELIAPTERGAYIAMRNATSQLAIAISAAAAGWLYGRNGFGAVALFATALSLLAALLVWSIKEPRRLE